MPEARRYRKRNFIVVAILLVVGLPIFLAVRSKYDDAYRRIRNQSHFRQIGVAIHNYHDGHNMRFPVLCDYGDGAPTGHGIHSMFFEILPQLEQANAYNLRLERNPATYYGKNGAASAQISVYIDPSDWSADMERVSSDGLLKDMEVSVPDARGSFPNSFTGNYATTSYAANGSLFQPNTSSKDIKDGSTNTITFASRCRVCETFRNVKIYNLWGLGAYGASTPGLATPLPEGDKYPTATPKLEQFVPDVPVPPGGAIEGRIGKEKERYSNMPQTSNAASGFQFNNLGFNCDPRIPQSFHRGGMIIGLADGSARTITDKISPNTFWAAVTPAGDEVLGVDW